MRFFPFLFLFSLSATINDPFRCEWFTGYRNDRIHWHLQDAATNTVTYSELYRDVEFWENGLVFKVIHRDIVFFVRGSYSAFGKGQLQETQAGIRQPRSHTTGWAADASGYLSYAVNLTNGRVYKWIFMPLVGYSGYFERLRAPPQNLRQSWYGVFLGAGLQIEPGGRLLFNLGYAYHWPHLHFTTHFLSSSEPTTNSFHTDQGGNLGQTGWAQVDYRFGKVWRVGLGAQVHYFSTPFSNVDTSQTPTSQTLKLRWVPIDGWMQISREL